MNRIKFDFTSNLMMINVYLWNIRMAKFKTC
jgi:hypothetical protein